MIYKQTKLYGIDAAIAQVQDIIHDGIGISSGFDVYGRVRRMERDKKFFPESFVSENEYRQVFTDDTKKGVVGFYVKDVRANLPMKKAEVEIIWTVNLMQMIGEDNDERMLLIAEKIINESSIEITKIKTGIQEVFKDFDKDAIRYRDMHPLFVFSFSTMMEYDNNLCDID